MDYEQKEELIQFNSSFLLKNLIKKMIRNIKAFLFDMDGVVTDTESQYDLFLGKLQKEYRLVPDFVHRIKGTTWTDIISNHFSHLTIEVQNGFMDKVRDFELNEMKYIPIPGVIDFIMATKKANIKIGLVTSSVKVKMQTALSSLKLETVFDGIVTADDVIMGKPDPECYLLGSKLVGIHPEECLVFEDSFAGIEAAGRAGMKAIGLSTTNTKESLQGKTDKIIPDFLNFKPEDFKKLTANG